MTATNEGATELPVHICKLAKMSLLAWKHCRGGPHHELAASIRTRRSKIARTAVTTPLADGKNTCLTQELSAYRRIPPGFESRGSTTFDSALPGPYPCLYRHMIRSPERETLGRGNGAMYALIAAFLLPFLLGRLFSFLAFVIVWLFGVVAYAIWLLPQGPSVFQSMVMVIAVGILAQVGYFANILVRSMFEDEGPTSP